jgi:hypothetical protein
MSKDAYYFPHDSNARHDPKIIAMMTVYGMQGYGWYWVIVEMLREQEGYRYSFDGKYSRNSMAMEMRTDLKTAMDFIDDCIEEFDLFHVEHNCLSCPSLEKRMERFDKRKAQAKAAAEARWGKEPKVRKLKPDPVPEPKEVDPAKVKNKDVITKKNYWDIFLSQLKEHDEFKNLPVPFIENEKNKFTDWLSAKGRTFKDYKAAFKNWLRNARDWSVEEEKPISDPNMNNPYKAS